MLESMGFRVLGLRKRTGFGGWLWVRGKMSTENDRWSGLSNGLSPRTFTDETTELSLQDKYTE